MSDESNRYCCIISLAIDYWPVTPLDATRVDETIIPTAGSRLPIDVGQVPIKIDFVSSSLSECMLVGAFPCINKIVSGKRESVS